MTKRRYGRELAFKTLYAADVARETPGDALPGLLDHTDAPDPDARPREDDGPAYVADGKRSIAELDFARDLIAVYGAHTAAIDQALNGVSKSWRLSRMSVVDRSILRLAAAEIMFCPETPAAVAINEAVELAKAYGGDESPKFVHALLDDLHKRSAPS